MAATWERALLSLTRLKTQSQSDACRPLAEVEGWKDRQGHTDKANTTQPMKH